MSLNIYEFLGVFLLLLNKFKIFELNKLLTLFCVHFLLLTKMAFTPRFLSRMLTQRVHHHKRGIFLDSCLSVKRPSFSKHLPVVVSSSSKLVSQANHSLDKQLINFVLFFCLINKGLSKEVLGRRAQKATQRPTVSCNTGEGHRKTVRQRTLV